MVLLAGLASLPVVGPSAVLALPGVARATLAFALVLALGGGILWRFDGLVDRTIEASAERPLAALGYGVAAHATMVFAGLYVASQLGQFSVAGRSLGVVGLWVGFGLLAVAAGLGFTAVGSAVVEAGWNRGRWHGLLLGAVLAGLIVLPDPLVAGVVWVVAVSAGIGGPVRRWLHASAGPGR
ncbi:MAG: hypothetical protein ABEJ92_00995 [Halobacteriales archaeon]